MAIVAVLFSAVVFLIVGSCFYMSVRGFFFENMPDVGVMGAVLGTFTLAFYISLWFR